MSNLSTGIPELDAAIKTVLGIVVGIIFFIGVYKVIMGVKAWSDANEEMDQARKSQGLNTIISGAVMCCVTIILTALGITL